MYAIVEIAGQQFKVEKGNKFFVNRLEDEEGSELKFDRVLLIDNEDKVTVARARRIRNFLSQPFHVAEGFNGFKGIYVSIKDTVRSFKAILEGCYDHYPESAFLYAGTIEDVEKKAGKK